MISPHPGEVTETGLRVKLMPESRKTCIVCEQPLAGKQLVAHPGRCRAAYQVQLKRARAQERLAKTACAWCGEPLTDLRQRPAKTHPGTCRSAYRAQERRGALQARLAETKCVVCGEPLTDHRQRAHPGACQRARRQTVYEQNKAAHRAKRIVPRGRQCVDCLARDHETRFSQEQRCDACLQRVQRNGRCERPHLDGTPGKKCGLILRGLTSQDRDGYCPAHDPPPYFIEVLWTSPDGRMRRIYRPITNGRVTLGGKWYIVKQHPFSVVVSVEKWVRVRA